MIQIGDKLMRTPTIDSNFGIKEQTPQRCVVDYINREHHFYRVRFENGTHECYWMEEDT